jgi:drug/metabolite transporter (DMT)-like permease
MWTRWRFELILLATIVVWGLNFPVLKAALGVMHPHVVNAFRFSVSVVVLGVLYLSQERRLGRRPFDPYRYRPLQIVTLGLFGFVVYQLCFIIGVNNTSAGTAALIMASAPVWTAVTGRILRIERLAGAAWIGLSVTLVGTVVIVLTGSKVVSFGSSALFGNLMILVASVCWGVYTALSRPVLQYVTPSGLAFLGLVPAVPVLLAVSIPYFGTIDWTKVNAWIWAALFFSGALSSGLAFVTWSISVKNLGSSHTAAYGNLVPLVALVFGYLLLSEPVTLGQVGGGSIVLTGLYVMRRSRRTRATSLERQSASD